MATLKPEYRPADQLSDDDVRAIVEIGRKQAELMGELEAAVSGGDSLRALDLARQLVGLEQQIKERQ